jgi:tetratricopeptide (TPR) repeat protein
MATKAKRAAEQPLAVAPQSDWRDLADRVAENPLLYVGAVLFVIVAAIAGWLVRVYQVSADQEFATAYARALEAEEEADVVAALEPLAEEQPVALYMLGETALRAGEMDKAKDAFTRVRQDYPKSPYAPDAAEGLGFMAESNGDYAEAKRIYQEILDTWPDSFAAKRQQFNIGRCEEEAGKPEAAIEAYRAQTLAFPNSRVATRATNQMTMLQAKMEPEATEADSELESALNAVLESTSEGEEAATPEAPVEAEVTEMPEETVETPPAEEAPKLELTLPEPGAGAGAVEMDDAEDTTP